MTDPKQPPPTREEVAQQLALIAGPAARALFLHYTYRLERERDEWEWRALNASQCGMPMKAHYARIKELRAKLKRG